MKIIEWEKLLQVLVKAYLNFRHQRGNFKSPYKKKMDQVVLR